MILIMGARFIGFCRVYLPANPGVIQINRRHAFSGMAGFILSIGMAA